MKKGDTAQDLNVYLAEMAGIQLGRYQKDEPNSGRQSALRV